jgi:hypothetical protein
VLRKILRPEKNVVTGSRVKAHSEEIHAFSLFFSVAQQPLVGQVLLFIEASRSHSDTPHLVGLLWMSDQPDAETPT